MKPPPTIVSAIFSSILQLRRLALRYLVLPRPHFMRLDMFTGKPNEHGRNYVMIHEGPSFYVQPTIWNRWGPVAWCKWALGQSLPGDNGDKYYPQGYYTPDLGPKYFEFKGQKELKAIKESLRATAFGPVPIPLIPWTFNDL